MRNPRKSYISAMKGGKEQKRNKFYCDDKRFIDFYVLNSVLFRAAFRKQRRETDDNRYHRRTTEEKYGNTCQITNGVHIWLRIRSQT